MPIPPSTERKTPASPPRRGVAAVEFAVMAPVFVAVILGTIGAAKALHALSTMSQALREGGRLAAMDWTGALPKGMTANDKVVRDIENFLKASNIDTRGMTVKITYADGPKKGTAFELGAPANYLELFQIEASIPHADANFWCSELTEGRGLNAKVVFRAGRSTAPES